MTILLSLQHTQDVSAFGRALYQQLVAAGCTDMATEAAWMQPRYHDTQDYLQAVLARFEEIEIEWQEIQKSV